VGSLYKDKVEHLSLDLYIFTKKNATFFVSGANPVHVIGYFEPEDNDSVFEATSAVEKIKIP
jgi:hypothetical protein